MTVRAIYEGGVFKPAGPVDLPERAEVELEARIVGPGPSGNSGPAEQADQQIFEILSRRYQTGQRDTAQRHDEHQP